MPPDPLLLHACVFKCTYVTALLNIWVPSLTLVIGLCHCPFALIILVTPLVGVLIDDNWGEPERALHYSVVYGNTCIDRPDRSSRAASLYWSHLGKSFVEVILFLPRVCGSSPFLSVACQPWCLRLTHVLYRLPSERAWEGAWEQVRRTYHPRPRPMSS